MLLLGMLPGLILIIFSIFFVVAFIRQLLSDPNSLFGLMLVGLMLGFCWYLWMHLPGFVRKFIHKVISKGGKSAQRKH